VTDARCPVGVLRRLPRAAPSIRWRLALLYTLVLGLCLLASDVLVYLALDRYLAEETDDSLSAQAQEIAGTTRIALVGGPGSFEVRVALPDLNVFSSPGLSVQVLSQDGQIVRRSENLGELALPISRPALEQAQDGNLTYETVLLDWAPVRIAYAPLRVGGEVVGAVQVARSLRDLEVALGRLRLAFLGIGLLSLLVATLGGWWLARAALRPIDRLTRDARTIGESRDFGRRVANLAPRDEVGRLATTFNEMLGQLQEAYDELEQTLASQRRFVADASHELRTPLTTVRTNLELLQRAADSLDLADRDEALADALAEIERLSRLVADLLTLARVDSGLRVERREPVRVDQVVRDVYRQGRLLALPRQQRLVLDNLEEVEVLGDPDQLKELFLILVDNAVTYTPRGGEIRLGAERIDGEVRVAVADDGVGIDSADLPHVFERFYRADRTRTRGSDPLRGGTGLGLSIARWIADEHGATIDVRSEAGRGSVFTVRLPALAPRAAPARLPAAVEA
jgi:two-component system, OmpR family, sensor kinase